MKWTNVEVKGNRRKRYPVTHSLTKSIDLGLDDQATGRVTDVTVTDHDLTKSIGFDLTDSPFGADGVSAGFEEGGPSTRRAFELSSER